MGASSEVTQQAKQYLWVPHLPQRPQSQGGRSGFKTSGVTKKTHKTSKHADQTSGEKEVRYPQEWVQFPIDKLWTPEAPSDAPCSGNKVWSQAFQHTVYYCYDVLHTEIFKLTYKCPYN